MDHLPNIISIMLDRAQDLSVADKIVYFFDNVREMYSIGKRCTHRACVFIRKVIVACGVNRL